MPENEFKKLFELFDKDEATAIKKYEEIRQSLSVYFGKRSDVYDPEALADETIYRVIRNLAKGDNLIFETGREGAYFIGVASRILSEYRREKTKTVSFEGLPPHQEPAFDPRQQQPETDPWLDKERLLECMAQCLANLPEEEQWLIIEYHRGDTGRKAGENSRTKIRRRLADESGLSLNALQLRASRIRRWLANRMEECLKPPAGGSVR